MTTCCCASHFNKDTTAHSISYLPEVVPQYSVLARIEHHFDILAVRSTGDVGVNDFTRRVRRFELGASQTHAHPGKKKVKTVAIAIAKQQRANTLTPGTTRID